MTVDESQICVNKLILHVAHNAIFSFFILVIVGGSCFARSAFINSYLYFSHFSKHKKKFPHISKLNTN